MDRSQCFDNLRKFGVRNFTNELEGYVQAFHAGPPSPRAQRTYAHGEGGDPCSHVLRYIQCDEQTHIYISLRRTRSRACCVAQWRMRSRSPGNLRSTTSVLLSSESPT